MTDRFAPSHDRSNRDAKRHKDLTREWYADHESISDLIRRGGISFQKVARGKPETVRLPLPPHLENYRLTEEDITQQGIAQTPGDAPPNGGDGDGREVDKDALGLQKGTIYNETNDETAAEDEGGDGDGDGKEDGEGDGDAAGSGIGDDTAHPLEMSNEELIDLLWAMFQRQYDLPFLEELGRKNIPSESVVYVPKERRGPRTILPGETYREALKRAIAQSQRDDDSDHDEDSDADRPSPVVDFISHDKMTKTADVEQDPESSAVFGIVLDKTGSMKGDQIELAKELALFVVTYLRKRYSSDAITLVLIRHTTEAEEIPEDNATDFWDTGASGGTRCSVGWELFEDIVRNRHGDDNVYLLSLSDGKNANEDDNRTCIDVAGRLIREQLVQRILYAEVQNPDSPPRKTQSDHPGVTLYYKMFLEDPLLGNTTRFLQGVLSDRRHMEELLEQFCRKEYEEESR